MPAAHVISSQAVYVFVVQSVRIELVPDSLLVKQRKPVLIKSRTTLWQKVKPKHLIVDCQTMSAAHVISSQAVYVVTALDSINVFQLQPLFKSVIPLRGAVRPDRTRS